MNGTLNRSNLILATFIALNLVGGAGAALAAGETKTLGNLQEAFNGESNANARYLAFAEQADKEGYAKVASIFRAAARAEAIHAENHAEVIRAMGAEPKADIAAPTVKDTAANLQAAIDGESYERDTMYPEFLAAGRAEGNKAALRTFNFALEAEAGHAELYADALNNLERMKGSSVQLYVCPVCGRTEVMLDGAKCPVCFTKNEEFIAVS